MTQNGSFKLNLIRRLGLLAGAVAFLAIYFSGWDVGEKPRTAAAMTALMVIWWMSEALPIHITALVPLVIVPITACLDPSRVGHASFNLQKLKDAFDVKDDGVLFQIFHGIDPYFHTLLLLFLGGMCIAAAMQKWNLHRRIALHVIRLVGSSANRLILGFVLATGFISMWISNTATAVMMVPIGLAVIRQLEQANPKILRLRHFGLAVMLAIAYGANVGGIGTLIGTAPNVIMSGWVKPSLSFLQYLPMGVPFVMMFLPVIWFVLTRVAARDRLPEGQGKEVIQQQIQKLGPMSREEKFVLFCFLLAAGLWICSGWIKDLLNIPFFKPLDSLSAMLIALILMTVPIRKGVRVLDWAALREIPWSILLLLGGSFAMAGAVAGSGLTDVLEKHILGLKDEYPIVSFFAVAGISVFVSAFASNTATTTLMMTLLRSFGVAHMATSSIAASCDFMLPAGTPPNAIVFGSGYVSVPRMMKTGFLLDILAALMAGLWGYLGIQFMLGYG